MRGWSSHPLSLGKASRSIDFGDMASAMHPTQICLIAAAVSVCVNLRGVHGWYDARPFLQPLDQLNTYSDCRLAPIIVDQGFAVTGEGLHETSKTSLDRKASGALRRAVGRGGVVAPKQAEPLLAPLVDCRTSP